MSDLDITFYSSEELLVSENSQEYMDFINSCFLPLHQEYFTFTTARFLDLDHFKAEFGHGTTMLAIARDVSTRDIVAAGGYKAVNDTTVELKCLSTDPKVAGRGIGTHMDDEIESRARKHGYKRILAMVIREHGKLAEFYERLGYEKQSVEVVQPGGEGFPNIVDITIWHMAKEL